MIGKSARKDLGFVFQPPECARMQYAIAIALEGAAISVLRLGIAPPSRLVNPEGIGRGHKPILDLRIAICDWQAKPSSKASKKKRAASAARFFQEVLITVSHSAGRA
jgi:hypothetical protein